MNFLYTEHMRTLSHVFTGHCHGQADMAGQIVLEKSGESRNSLFQFHYDLYLN